MPVASIELSSTHSHNYLFIFVLKCVVEMALYKYLTKEKDKLVEGEEFVEANELVEEILKEERMKYFHPNRDMKLVNMHPNMAMQVPRENSAQCLTKK